MDISSPDSRELSFDASIHRLARELVQGVKDNKWSPIIYVDTRLPDETWIPEGKSEYKDNLWDYLKTIWSHKQPHAAFLEAYGYFQRIPPKPLGDRPSSNDATALSKYERAINRVGFILSEKAFDLLNPSANDVSVFISYRRSVSSLQALLLSNWLHRNKIENFLDIENPDGGGPLKPYIVNAIKSRSHFICILGVEIKGEEQHHTLQSSWVVDEINYALEKEKVCIPFFSTWLVSEFSY